MRSVKLVSVVVALLSLAFLAPTTSEAEGEPTWLVVLQGKVNSISDREMSIAANPQGVAFTERPKRTARLLDLAAFVEAAWATDGDFRKNPPNASVVNATENTVSVVTVTDATWNDGVLTLTFTALEGGLPTVGDYVALTMDSIFDNSRAH